MDYAYTLFLVALIWAAVVEAQGPLGHKCGPTDAKYTPGFKGSLNSLMRKFQGNLPDIKYLQDQVLGPGKDNNVYGSMMCRADTTLPECKACISAGSTELFKKCGDQREGFIAYDKCMIRFGDHPYYGSLNNTDDFYGWDATLVSNADELSQKTKGLLTGLIGTCTGAQKRFAQGTAPFGSKTLYGMAMCTWDLSPENCAKCLRTQIDAVGGGKCCYGMQGGRAVGTSCSVRYEIYPFIKK